ncbi:NAD(P)H-hydrate dehydratase [Flavobacterium microcysteis]
MQHIPINKQEILKRYRPITVQAHKGTQGHALIIGGSYGKIGSIILASKASLRSGCGLVTAFIPKCGYNSIQTSFPEAMVITDKMEEHISKIEFDIIPNAIAIGMGMGQHEATQKAFGEFLKNNDKPLLIDADGINILSKNKELFDFVPERTVLTPHKKELQRLIGDWDSEEEKIEKTAKLAESRKWIMVIKGAPTQIISNNVIYTNSTGNQALATAGSGDTLSGIIVGLLAQGYKPEESAILGVYIHGLTADIGSKILGYHAFIATDIIEYLGKAFLSLDEKL